ncbi:hypothetical protein [Paenibacillus silviterrae]|uniref:hypothetical protein n=1 Tax=Paenibacillus silviterrae TaxID=3242194 RepID=UPI0025430CA6|nr:hypothetical protein [Paenibacillus chinjuensis]
MLFLSPERKEFTDTDIIGSDTITGIDRSAYDFILVDQLPQAEDRMLEMGDKLPEGLKDVRDQLPETIDKKTYRLEAESLSTMLAIAESYEKQIADTTQREQETVETMLGLAEAYEIILQQGELIAQQADRIAQLESRLEQVEQNSGGTS